MPTTTTFSVDVSGLVPTINGRPITGLPFGYYLYQTGDSTQYTAAPGTCTTYAAGGETVGGVVRHGYSAGVTCTHLIYLKEDFGAGLQTYGDFSPTGGGAVPAPGAGFSANVTENNLTWQSSDTTDGAAYGGDVAAGSHGWDITPAVNVVARWTDGTANFNAPADGNKNYFALSGVAMTVTVARSGGASYALASGTTSTGNTGGTFQSNASGGGTHASGAALPAALYDPWFGRTPTAVKDVTGLRLQITNTDGTTYDYTVPAASLVVGSSIAVPSGTLAISYQATYAETYATPCGDFAGSGYTENATADNFGSVVAAPPAYWWTNATGSWSRGSRTVNLVSLHSSSRKRENFYQFRALPGLVLKLSFTTGLPVYPPTNPGATQTVLLTEDLDGRPCGAAVDTTPALKVYSSKAMGTGGGPAFDTYSPGLGTAPADASLVVSPRTGQRLLFWADGTAGLSRAVAAQDGEAGGWGTASLVLAGAGLTTVLAHPTDPDRLLLLSGLTLYESGDGGLTWASRGGPSSMSQATGAGRAALMCLGNAVALAAGTAPSGTAATGLTPARSADGGATWTTGSPLWTPGTGASLVALAGCARDGVLWLAALVSTTSGGTTTLSVLLWGSGDLGATWQSLTAPTVASAAPGLFALSRTHRLLWSTAQYSDTAGASWSAN